MAIDKNKLKLVQTAVSSIQKQFGQGAIMRLGEARPIAPVDSVSTGSLGVDLILGIGGIPRGRITEIFGPESSGKTTLALHTIAEFHRAGHVCAFIDAEHALDMAYAERLGVDPKKLLISQPDHGEQALEIAETLLRSGCVELIVVDSVAALVPRAEIEGEMGDSHMGLQARLMSQAMRKLTGIASRTGCALVFINQLRQKIGVTFGNPEVTTGGNALKFYASVRIDVRRIAAVKHGHEIVGNHTRIKAVKNKLAAPFQQVEVDIMYGKGIWAAADLLDRAVEHGIVDKAGSWFSWQEQRLGQGRDKAARHLEEHPEISSTIRKAVLVQHHGDTLKPDSKMAS